MISDWEPELHKYDAHCLARLALKISFPDFMRDKGRLVALGLAAITFQRSVTRVSHAWLTFGLLLHIPLRCMCS